MKIIRFLPVVIIPLLFACLPKKPEIPMTEVPAGQLVQALEQRLRSFSGLKAMAGIRAVRKDRRRSFETVAVLVRGQERFRMDAYGPLGETLVSLVWNGETMVADLGGQRRVIPPKSSGLERLLGADVDPAELCAIFSGNVPAASLGPDSRVFCSGTGTCVLETKQDEKVFRVHPAQGWESKATVRSYEVYRGRSLVYRVIYGSPETVSGYSLPRTIVVENPDKRMTLTISYSEAEVNVSLQEEVFTLPGEEGTDR